MNFTHSFVFFFFLSSSPVLSVLLQVNVSRFVTVFLYIIIMVQIALAFVATALVSVQASPFFSKRIAQTINQSTVKWEAACVRYYPFSSINHFLIFSVRIRRLKKVYSATNWPSPLSIPCSRLLVPVLNKMVQMALWTYPRVSKVMK